MNRYEGISDEDLAHYADTEKDAYRSPQEQFIDQMDMKDIWYFFGDIGGAAQSALIQAIRDQDEHEVGAVFMQALREYAEVNTE